MTLAGEQAGDMLRFGGMSRLYGAHAFETLARAHVCVIGVGGVGSWAAEAIARSGVGAITLVDLDEICVSNSNRQLHTTGESIGQSKIEVMGRRIQSIAPSCKVQLIHDLFTPKSAASIFSAGGAEGFSGILDAIDGEKSKSALIVESVQRGIPLVVSGGAGGRVRPELLRVGDLKESTHDGLLLMGRGSLVQE